jgi:hypothetical protein
MAAAIRRFSASRTITYIMRAAAAPMRLATPLGRLASAGLLLLGLAWSVAPLSAGASNVKFVGNATYTFNGKVAVLTADEIRNFDASGSSGPLHLELWAVATPFDGGPVTGYKLAEYTLGQLVAGFSYSNVSSGSVPFTPPPDGEWTYTMFVTEYTSGAPVDDGCLSVQSARQEGYTYTACMHASGWLKR